MAIITLEEINLEYGTPPLLRNATCQFDQNERVCVIGRNGVGKSTFLKIIAGQLLPDSGRIIKNTELRISYLQQPLPEKSSQTVAEYVATGLGNIGQVLSHYYHCLELYSKDTSDAHLKQLERAQHQLEAQDGWSVQQKVDSVLTRLQLDGNATLDALSGGWLKRVDLARALVNDPELLLLDEPTNHLDIPAIQWLEKVLLDFNGTLIFISHDRSLIRNLSTRLIELDRGQLTSWPGDYDNYLVKKAEQLEIEEKQNALFDKKLAQEEVWIRQGIKARRTRNEGRVLRLKEMRDVRQQRLTRQGKANFQVEQAQSSGKLVVEAENISFQYENRSIVNQLSTRIMRGDKVAIIGPNGCGKSTLLNLLLGNLQPTQGSIRLGTNLHIAYYDQHRDAIDLNKTVEENVGEGQTELTVGGQKRHIISYLNDFLFAPDRARTPAHVLSGGELNRLLLAKLFLKPSNVLILDEPTNDLDVETLELLEERLFDYPGTVILVSHDRAFIDNVVTASLVFEEGAGHIQDYVGGYSDAKWQKAQMDAVEQQSTPSKASNTQKSSAASTPSKKSRKLSYKLQLEYDALPAKIEALESDIAELEQQVNASGFYQQSGEQSAAILSKLTAAQEALEASYERWDELESLQSSIEQ